MLVAGLGSLLVLSKQLLGALGEGAGQTAVTGLGSQQVLVLLGVDSLGGQLKVNRFQ